MMKDVFWLVYLGEKLKGKNPPRTWKGLDKFVKDEKHIIHDAYGFRMNPTKDKRKRKVFVIKLEKYIKDLEKIK